MQNLTPFKFSDHYVRTLSINGEPWLVASDVAKILGYENASRDVARHVHEDDRSTVSVERGGTATVINESGLYALVMRSNKPNAREFQRWVTRHVLPSIRQNGGYIAGQEADDPELIMAKAVLAAQRVIERKTAELEQARAEIDVLAPKAAVYDRVSDSRGALTLTQAAKTLGLPPRKFTARLEEDGILYRQGGVLTAYQKHIEAGRFELKLGEANGFGYAQLKVTPAGVQWLANRYMSELAE